MDERLSKILARSGVASRRACEALIFAKRVKVNGKVILEPQTRVNPEVDKILVDNRPIVTEVEHVYFIFHKPVGFVCSHNKQFHHATIYEHFGKENASRLFSVGRLDKDTSGLLLITNDGIFANSVIHPSAEITKEYVAKTPKEILDSHLKAIQKGCFVEGKWVTPCKVIKVRKGTLKITVQDGRKREVRCLLENAGLPVAELKRIAIGGLRLGALPEGSYRPLSKTEKQQIFA